MGGGRGYKLVIGLPEAFSPETIIQCQLKSMVLAKANKSFFLRSGKALGGDGGLAFRVKNARLATVRKVMEESQGRRLVFKKGYSQADGCFICLNEDWQAGQGKDDEGFRQLHWTEDATEVDDGVIKEKEEEGPHYMSGPKGETLGVRRDIDLCS